MLHESVALNLMQHKWNDLFVSDISSNADVHIAIKRSIEIIAEISLSVYVNEKYPVHWTIH